MPAAHDPDRLDVLEALAAKFPTVDEAISEASSLRAKLTLPMGVVHVISAAASVTVTASVTPGQTATLSYRGLRGGSDPPDDSGDIVLSSYLVIER